MQSQDMAFKLKKIPLGVCNSVFTEDIAKQKKRFIRDIEIIKNADEELIKVKISECWSIKETQT